MYELNPDWNSENMPPFNHKTALTSNVWKKSQMIFFQTDNQPTVGTNVTGNHNIGNMIIYDSLYILVE